LLSATASESPTTTEKPPNPITQMTLLRIAWPKIGSEKSRSKLPSPMNSGSPMPFQRVSDSQKLLIAGQNTHASSTANGMSRKNQTTVGTRWRRRRRAPPRRHSGGEAVSVTRVSELIGAIVTR
jgi:hypothetical protein